MPQVETPASGPAPRVSAEAAGLLAGIGAYVIWGFFPLLFPLLKPAGPLEILAHRIIWSMVAVGVVLLVLRRPWGWLREALSRNPILVTALNPIIGYQKAAEIAKQAYREGRPIIDVALESSDLKGTDLDRARLEQPLDPEKLTAGGL